MEHEEGRQRQEREELFIDSRGGRAWLEAFVRPFYLTISGIGPHAEDAEAILPLLKARAFEVTLGDIAEMVTMQWRLQVAGVWFAIARSEPSLSEALHHGFRYCYGSLSAPSLTVAALTYPNSTTAEVLGAYRDRDVQHDYGSAALITSALQRLAGGVTDDECIATDDQRLDELLARAHRIQSMP